MVEPNINDDIDCGSFFDHIDDLLDFPADDSDVAAGDSDLLENFCQPESVSIPNSHSLFSDSGKASPDLSTEISVPYEDIVQLEWLSNFVEDSFSWGSLTMKKVEPSCAPKEDMVHTQFQASSPVSVLESSNSGSSEKNAPRGSEIYIPVPCGRARSKRLRPATFNPHPVMQLISPSSSIGQNTQPNVTSKAAPDSENIAGSHKKKKKIKVSFPLDQADTINHKAPSQAVRKCMHCEITKTPQWRAGPMGPKTLCNACGVRYKSGRLFPEYRPAASPTFCPAVHSNSHKKVLEMRDKTSKKSGFRTDSAASPELIPNINSSLTLECM